MTAITFDPHTLIAESRLGVLATIKSNGLPQLSPVTPFYDRDAGVIYVSMTEGRAKTANLRRVPAPRSRSPVPMAGRGRRPRGPRASPGREPIPTVPKSKRSSTTTAALPENTPTGTSTAP